MLNELDVTPKKTAIAALASTNDSRVAVLTGNCGKFTELAQLMPAMSAPGEAPTAVTTLIEALEQVTRNNDEAGDLHE